MKEAWHSKVLRDRGMIVAGGDGVENLATPIRFQEEPGAPSFECAELGGHTDEILERLGYDKAARAALHAAKVC